MGTVGGFLSRGTGRVLGVGVALLVGLAPLGLTPAPAIAGTGCRRGAPSATAALVPQYVVPPDPAVNVDDPDAAREPLRRIRYPDEVGFWVAAGLDHRAVSVALTEETTPTRVFPFADARRPDAAYSDSIVRLFCGLFARPPNPFELEYWSARYENGLPLVSIAEAFTVSEEFVSRHGMPDDAGLVPLLYRDVLGRTPAGDVGPLLARVRRGELSRGALVTLFTESPEFVSLTGTTPPRKPPLPYPDVGSGKRIIYTNGGGRIWLVAATGELVKTHLVSGRRGVPKVGRYRVFSKSRHAWAPYGGITMEYMVRFARGTWPYGFHSIPVYADKRPLQTVSQLGQHLSGGCVRQDFDDAEFVYHWADVGTRVIVIP